MAEVGPSAAFGLLFEQGLTAQGLPNGFDRKADRLQIPSSPGYGTVQHPARTFECGPGRAGGLIKNFVVEFGMESAQGDGGGIGDGRKVAKCVISEFGRRGLFLWEVI